jgi:hypothetical protein
MKSAREVSAVMEHRSTRLLPPAEWRPPVHSRLGDHFLLPHGTFVELFLFGKLFHNLNNCHKSHPGGLAAQNP